MWRRRLRAGWYRLGAPYQRLPAGHGAILVPFGDDMKFQVAHATGNFKYSNIRTCMLYDCGPPADVEPDPPRRQNAMKQYDNMDKLIKAVNSRFDTYGVHVRCLIGPCSPQA